MDSHEQDNCAQRDRIERAAQIRELNDLLRVEQAGGQLFVTHGICSLGERYVPSMIQGGHRVRRSSHVDNDPTTSAISAALDVLGQRIFWKIDYYDRADEDTPRLTRRTPMSRPGC
jgi:hypothetical protein